MGNFILYNFEELIKNDAEIKIYKNDAEIKIYKNEQIISQKYKKIKKCCGNEICKKKVLSCSCSDYFLFCENCGFENPIIVCSCE